MRKTLWRFHVLYLMAFGVLVAMMAFGCEQSAQEGGGEQTSEDRTASTQAGTTAQEMAGETTRPESTTQRTESGGEETTQEQPSQQQRQQAQEQAQQRAEQQQQQAQQQQRQAPQQGQQGQQQQQGDKQTIMVRIAGTEGVSFTGRIGSAQDLRRVQGSVPKEYELPFRGAAVTAAIRKQQPGQGTLGVEVVRDGEVVASQETSTTTGVVNVVWTPQRQGN